MTHESPTPQPLGEEHRDLAARIRAEGSNLVAFADSLVSRRGVSHREIRARLGESLDQLRRLHEDALFAVRP